MLRVELRGTMQAGAPEAVLIDEHTGTVKARGHLICDTVTANMVDAAPGPFTATVRFRGERVAQDAP